MREGEKIWHAFIHSVMDSANIYQVPTILCQHASSWECVAKTVTVFFFNSFSPQNDLLLYVQHLALIRVFCNKNKSIPKTKQNALGIVLALTGTRSVLTQNQRWIALYFLKIHFCL